MKTKISVSLILGLLLICIPYGFSIMNWGGNNIAHEYDINAMNSLWILIFTCTLFPLLILELHLNSMRAFIDGDSICVLSISKGTKIVIPFSDITGYWLSTTERSKFLRLKTVNGLFDVPVPKDIRSVYNAMKERKIPTTKAYANRKDPIQFYFAGESYEALHYRAFSQKAKVCIFVCLLIPLVNLLGPQKQIHVPVHIANEWEQTSKSSGYFISYEIAKSSASVLLPKQNSVHTEDNFSISYTRKVSLQEYLSFSNPKAKDSLFSLSAKIGIFGFAHSILFQPYSL